jgi:Asp-tRNA(Asn)/Glu-tRNA(Gln) amidotransferase A subunit family amidase
MSHALQRLTARELLALLRSGQCTAQEVVESCLAEIEQQDPVVRAFVQVDGEGALKRARELDREEPSTPLHGLPIAVKDTIDVVGLKCTLGSPVHASRVAASDAGVVRRLRGAGAIIIGTTVTTEYAIARAGPTRNPHHTAHTAGGSSSGSAAAVAAGMVPLALGTQTIGSIVRPAAYCGIFGFKPTFGAVDREGCMPLSSRLDHIGPMGRTVEDLMLACKVIRDPQLTRGATELSPRMPARVFRIEEPFQERILPATHEALGRAQAMLEAAGIEVQEMTLPSRFADARACWETILFRDIARNHGADRDAYGEAMSERLRSIIDSGREVTESDYKHALAQADTLRRDLQQRLTDSSIILAPATDGAAPPFSDETGPSQLQGLWSLVGFPALAVPCGKVGVLPVGVQLVGVSGDDDLVLHTGALFTAESPAEAHSGA